MFRRLVALGVFLFAIIGSASAFAGDAGLAEALFQQGRRLMDQRDYRPALSKLAESYAQDPATGSLLALAICQEQLGLSASAWANYSEVVSRAKREGREDRVQAARERMQALESVLSRLTIEVDARLAATPGLLVARDGRAIGPAAWGYPSPPSARPQTRRP
jgi:tetratricopeptide (TPR) repeat protein